MINYPVPLGRPKIGSSGLTGHWRLMRPEIDYSKCTKCRLCVIYCPENTIDLLEGFDVRIDYDYCKGCGVCAQICPQKAIQMIPEVK